MILHDLLLISSTFFCTLWIILFAPWKVQWHSLNDNWKNILWKKDITSAKKYTNLEVELRDKYRENGYLMNCLRTSIRDDAMEATSNLDLTLNRNPFSQFAEVEHQSLINMVTFERLNVRSEFLHRHLFDQHNIEIFKRSIIDIFIRAGEHYFELIKDSKRFHTGEKG